MHSSERSPAWSPAGALQTLAATVCDAERRRENQDRPALPMVDLNQRIEQIDATGRASGTTA
jgi:hypothetical protein